MEIILTGGLTSPEIVRRATALVSEQVNEGKKPLNGEPTKTPEDLSLIAAANHAFKEEFEELGIPHLFKEVDPHSVHFLPDNVYKELYPNTDRAGFADKLKRTIVLNKDSEGFLFAYLHEVAHLLSYQSFSYEEARKLVAIKQDGLQRHTKSKSLTEAFMGLNEAICDMSAYVVQSKNFNLFYGDEANPANTRHGYSTYPEEVAILEAIIDRVAEQKGKTFLNVWQNFHRSFYTGDYSVLNQLEAIFGKGSLRILAVLGLERVSNVPEEKQIDYRKSVREHFLKVDNLSLEKDSPWDSPDIISPWAPEGNPITIREVEEREYEEIKSYFKNGHFEVPDDEFGEGYVRIMYFEDMYGHYAWLVKEEVTDEERQVMIAHNRRLLNFLKEMGWYEEMEIMYPNPESID